jgi:hypothetical protein
MSEYSDNQDAQDEKAHENPPNTLAWAALAYDQTRKPKAPPRIQRREVAMGPVSEAQPLMDSPLPELGMPVPENKEESS